MDFLEKAFKLKQNGTNVRTEVIAGITTFMTMAYILAVNPNILSAAMGDANKGAIFTATALASAIGTVCMAAFSNYPFALAPGMGLNAFFAYTVVLNMGYSWQTALTAVFVEGIIFLILSLFNVREAMFNAIPQTLKYAVSAGIGLFITFIGVQNANIVILDTSTKVTFFKLSALQQANPAYAFNNVGITVVLAFIGLIITAVLIIKKVKGNILWGILITYVLGIICQLVGLYVPNPDAGMFSLFPDFSNGMSIPSIRNIAFKLDFSNILSLNFIVVVFSFLFVDIFDTLGTLIGVSSKANMLDKDGKLPRIKGALLSDAVATTLGAALGTSTTTTFVESASGVVEGGRTGLTSITTAILFLLALFLSPIFLAIPSFATAPALIAVGFYMIASISKINFDDIAEGIPAFITIVAMPFAYSISEGISLGIIFYVAINMLTGKLKKITTMMWILAILFVAKYIFI